MFMKEHTKELGYSLKEGFSDTVGRFNPSMSSDALTYQISAFCP
jgi:hypothetical protein